MFKPVSPKVNFPTLEEDILKYWKKEKIFEHSIESRPKNKRWTFLDGPPFVTGMPHYGSLLSSLPKDVFGRYWTMKGYRVRRVWGWDGHGLPIENKVEGELEIKRKKDIEEKVGIKKFIERCLHYVNQVSDEWEWYVDHIGRWVDFKNAYKTWDLPYMESVMWVFKQMYDKGYVYKGFRVSLYCPHCATPISNFEVAMDADNHKDIQDVATTYKYELENQKKDLKTYILAWSTTPWNKIVTTALAVNPEFTYVKVKQGNEYYILAKSTLKMLKEDIPYEIVDEFKGSTLVGKKFVPHYDYYPIEPGEKVFEIIAENFVTAEEGTGVVTIAAYGEEDLHAMQKHHIHKEMHLDEEGMIKPDVPKFGGMYYLKANKAVDDDLAERGLVYKQEEISHTVAFCWRCGTRLYHGPIDAWFVNVQTLKNKMKNSNELVNWFPKHFKHGRFLKSLENAPDWNISRNRYWGSPVPVWDCRCGERFVPGSIKELEDASGKKITNLHKPDIDSITVTCKKCGKKVHRVPEVLDSWIEAGSASFAERHYPFEGTEKVENFFPPDFIAEYTGQIRAWFYVMHVIANALDLRDDNLNILAKNVLVEGVILGTDGRKMSKNYKNYPDPKEMLQKYGGDALRLYLLGSPVMHGDDILISEERYRQQVKGTMLILWNVYNFFVTYANIDGWEPSRVENLELRIENVLDKWIISKLHGTIRDVIESLDKYDTKTAILRIDDFVQDLSLWYVRRSRDRIGPTAENGEDKNACYQTLYLVLQTVSKVLAPIAPFMTEEIYRNLTNSKSVHLVDFPVFHESLINKTLEKEMTAGREVVSIILMKRKNAGVKVRIPLKKVAYTGPEKLTDEIVKIVSEEVNVHELDYAGKSSEYEVVTNDSEFTDPANQDVLFGQAREIVRMIQEERKKLETKLDERIDVTLETWPSNHEDYIKRNALINSLRKGDSFQVKRLQ